MPSFASKLPQTKLVPDLICFFGGMGLLGKARAFQLFLVCIHSEECFKESRLLLEGNGLFGIANLQI